VYTIRIEDSFSSAHFLAAYNGKCENLHGHNYHIRAYAKGRELDKSGILVDFSIFKKALKEILDPIDHVNLNDLPAFSDNNPSAEKIAKYIFEKLTEKLPSVSISKVEVFETEKNMACYRPLRD